MKDSSSNISFQTVTDSGVAAATVVAGVVCVVLSLWTNPVVLGRFVQSPPAHYVYFLIGAFLLFAGNRFSQLQRCVRSLEERQNRGSDNLQSV